MPRRFRDVRTLALRPKGYERTRTPSEMKHAVETQKFFKSVAAKGANPFDLVTHIGDKPIEKPKKISKADARFNRMYESQDRGVNSASSGPSTVAPKPSARIPNEVKKSPFERLDSPEVIARAEQLRTGKGLKGMDSFGLKPELALARARSEARMDAQVASLKRDMAKPEVRAAVRAKFAADAKERLLGKEGSYAKAVQSAEEAALRTPAGEAARQSRNKGVLARGEGDSVFTQGASLPDLAHLAKENKIPADPSQMRASGMAGALGYSRAAVGQPAQTEAQADRERKAEIEAVKKLGKPVTAAESRAAERNIQKMLKKHQNDKFVPRSKEPGTGGGGGQDGRKRVPKGNPAGGQYTK